MALCRVSEFLVDPQQSGVLKTLGAQVAAERFVSRHVSFEVRFVPEILSAAFTLGISHGMSLHHVREELVFFQYNMRAPLAFEGHGNFVAYLSVTLKASGVQEILTAQAALEQRFSLRVFPFKVDG